MPPRVDALAFDVFGTVVDWRGSLIAQLTALGAELHLEADWAAFADAWRAQYQPSMEEVRSGRRSWTVLDDLHRESLVRLLDRCGARALDNAQIDRLNMVWHQLDAWPDSAEGLRRLRRKYLVVALSNGNIRLMADVARHAGLVWDAILGAEFARQYKPRPEVYLAACAALRVAPERCLMVAAHNSDLQAAKALRLRTAFVHRPTEYGPQQTTDLRADDEYDVIVPDLVALADALGAPAA